MQKNLAICIIILVTLAVVAISWAAVSCWRTRFRRELLVTKQSAWQLRETRGSDNTTTTEATLLSSEQTEPRSNRGKGKERKTNEPAAEPLMTGARQRETNTVVYPTERPEPARTEQIRPDMPRESEWSGTTGTTGVSSEAPGGERGRVEPSTGEWDRSETQIQTMTMTEQSQGGWREQDTNAKAPAW